MAPLIQDYDGTIADLREQVAELEAQLADAEHAAAALCAVFEHAYLQEYVTRGDQDYPTTKCGICGFGVEHEIHIAIDAAKEK